MTLAGAIVLLVVFVLAWRGRPLVPRDRTPQMSDRWRLDHLYTNGKHGP